MNIDTSNTDPEYWEKILVESDLSTNREAPQAIPITTEEFKELVNVDLLPEEDFEQQDTIRFNGITKTTHILNTDHSGLSETNGELRTKIGADDIFFTGHGIIKQHRGDTAKKSGIPRACPDWALDNNKIREILLQAFPRLQTDDKQRKAAGRWARIIQMYFKAQMTHGQIAIELNTSLNTVLMAIRRINRAVKGFRTDTGKPRGIRGRPRKIMT